MFPTRLTERTVIDNTVFHSKKIGPSQWDLSLAEHLAPGETYKQVCTKISLSK